MTTETLRSRQAFGRARLRLALTIFAFEIFAAAPAVAQVRGGGGLPPRDEWQRVPDIIAALAITEGRRVADIAAGQGYLTKPLARAVGKAGRVYAVEISEDARRGLAELAARESLTNVEVVAGTATDPGLSAPVDGAVILNSYHELTDHEAILAAILRALRPGGRLVLVDNTNLAGHDSTRAGQVRRHAIDPAFVDAELRAAGFEIVDRQDGFIVQPFPQWLIIARRPVT
jgi:predicted methyltransferase